MQWSDEERFTPMACLPPDRNRGFRRNSSCRFRLCGIEYFSGEPPLPESGGTGYREIFLKAVSQFNPHRHDPNSGHF
jgi:hypothetical protein